MAPEKQQKLEDVAGIKRQREGEEEAPANGTGGGEEHATNGGKQGAPAEQPEPKHLKISDAPASVLEEGRIYFYYRYLHIGNIAFTLLCNPARLEAAYSLAHACRKVPRLGATTHIWEADVLTHIFSYCSGHASGWPRRTS